MASLQIQSVAPVLLALVLHVTEAVLPPGGPLHSFPGGGVLSPPTAGTGPPTAVAFQPQAPTAPSRRAFSSGGDFRESPVQPQPYAFQYAVTDAQSGAAFRQQEDSDGSAIRGQYSVQLPDGRNQIVKYAATDATGFNAEVLYEGSPRNPEPTKSSSGFGRPSPSAFPVAAAPDFASANIVPDFGNPGKPPRNPAVQQVPVFDQPFPPLRGPAVPVGFGDFGSAGKNAPAEVARSRGGFGIRTDFGGGQSSGHFSGAVPFDSNG